MQINAAKTEIMNVDPSGDEACLEVVLSGGKVKHVGEVKYLGGWMQGLHDCDKEVRTRRARAMVFFGVSTRCGTTGT